MTWWYPNQLDRDIPSPIAKKLHSKEVSLQGTLDPCRFHKLRINKIPQSTSKRLQSIDLGDIMALPVGKDKNPTCML